MLKKHVFCTPRRIAGIIGLLLGLSAASVNAGSLDAPAAPTAAASAMFTLTDLYDRLNAGTAGAPRPGAFVEPVAGPTAGTGYTLNEIMAKMPTLDNANGAGVSDVLAGKTFWGLTGGAWGLQTGTATARASFTGGDGVKVIPIPDGLYSGGQTATATDTDLLAANIKTGVNLFGTVGTFTSDGDAVAADIATGKKAYVAGNLVTGSATAGANVTGADGSLSMTIPDGLYSGSKTATAADSNLTTANIRATVTIFGVTGDTNVVNTSSGDAVAADIATGKKAWVDGAEVTGTASGGGSTTAVPKTGQTLCYNASGTSVACAGTGQDGELQKGAALPSSRFTDHSNGTVTDNLTGLIWLKNANCANATRVWETALSDVVSLNTNGEMNNNDCGDTSNANSHQTDWRLPNVNELKSLIDHSQSSSLPFNHPFTDVQLNFYWSSTTNALSTNFAWNMNPNGGLVNFTGKGAAGHVWPVRGGL